jgi:hypothetical protein
VGYLSVDARHLWRLGFIFLQGRKQFMRLSKSLAAISAGLAICCAVFLSAVPASAYVVCNGSSSGDCWHTGSKSLDWSGVALKYHDDDWWDAHKGDAQYHFHDNDAEHQWEQGYWRKGEWRRGF